MTYVRPIHDISRGQHDLFGVDVAFESVSLGGVGVLAVGVTLLVVQTTHNGNHLDAAVDRALGVIPYIGRVRDRFEATHWALGSQLWKYAALMTVAIVAAGIDLAWLNLDTVDPAWTIAGGLALGVGTYALGEATAVLTDYLGFEYETQMRATVAPSNARGWLGLTSVTLVVVSVWEELLFRGVLVGVAAATLGVSPWVTGAIAVAVFGAIHQTGTGGIVVAGVMGIALTAAFVLGANLALLVLAHTTANALEFLVHEHDATTGLPRDKLGLGE